MKLKLATLFIAAFMVLGTTSSFAKGHHRKHHRHHHHAHHGHHKM